MRQNPTLTAFDSGKNSLQGENIRSNSPTKPESILDDALGSGSAVVINAEKGFVVTNNHVTDGGSVFKVEINGSLYTAVLMREDANNDLSLLQIEKSGRGQIMSLPIAMSANVGSKVYSAGFPDVVNMGMDIKVTEGIISSVSFLKDPSKYQISCPITSGNSGGALLDKHGNLIGITQGGYRPDINTENVNAAVKALYVIGLAQTESTCSLDFKLRTSEIDFNKIDKSVVPILIYE